MVSQLQKKFFDIQKVKIINLFVGRDFICNLWVILFWYLSLVFVNS